MHRSNKYPDKQTKTEVEVKNSEGIRSEMTARVKNSERIGSEMTARVKNSETIGSEMACKGVVKG